MEKFYLAFLLIYGTLSLVLGILNKGNALWMSLYDDSKKLWGKHHSRVINITMGLISIWAGIMMYLKHYNK
ncbi:hypothetical protein [Pollutibacter soli]|uniref:hypothetical protein n=1 Tax=Pollutibacter soli TaxID=3034157 RepID=UPI003013F37B